MNEHKGSLNCPACATEAIKIGRLHRVRGVIELVDPGELFFCPECGLYFRYPYPDQSDLTKAYASISANQWNYGEREDYRIAGELLNSHFREGKILDVGCFRGDFLASMPESFELFGVEPSAEAAGEAKKRGVKLLAATVDELDADTMKFDAITLLDVLEHIPSPLIVLEKLAAALKPGGVLIVATGNSAALPWRLLRLEYWYYFPEHVSFFSQRWFQWAAGRLGLRVASVEAFAHINGSLFARVYQLIQAAVYRVVSGLKEDSVAGRVIRRLYPFSRITSWGGAPVTNRWRDHMLIVLRKCKQ